MARRRVSTMGLATALVLFPVFGLLNAAPASATDMLASMRIEVASPCVDTGCKLTVVLQGQNPAIVPTGTITLSEDASSDALVSTNGGLCRSLALVGKKKTASAKCSAYIPPGNDAIGAIYSGDRNYASDSTQQFIQLQITAIHSAKVSGTTANPTITIHGKYFGAEPTWAATSALCDGSGSNFGSVGTWPEPLYFEDTTANWDAGQPEDCVGLLVSSYSANQIVFRFGSYYDKAGSKKPVVLAPGASFTVSVFGVKTSTTAKYPAASGNDDPFRTTKV